MEGQEKRKARSYKISDTSYLKALKRGQREKSPLAKLLEDVVKHYGNGYTIVVFDKGESIPVKAKCLS